MSNTNAQKKSTFVPFLLAGFARKYDIIDPLANLMVASLAEVAGSWDAARNGIELPVYSVVTNSDEAAITLARRIIKGDTVVFEDQEFGTVFFCRIYEGALVAAYHPLTMAFNRVKILCSSKELSATIGPRDLDDMTMIAKLFDIPLPKKEAPPKPEPTTSFRTESTARRWYTDGEVNKTFVQEEKEPVVPETPRPAASPQASEPAGTEATSAVGAAMHAAFKQQQAEAAAAASVMGTK